MPSHYSHKRPRFPRKFLETGEIASRSVYTFGINILTFFTKEQASPQKRVLTVDPIVLGESSIGRNDEKFVQSEQPFSMTLKRGLSPREPLEIACSQ